MPIQLTPDQEQRIRIVVSRGAYGSAEEAVEAAVAAVEMAAVADFDGGQQELEEYLMEGMASKEVSAGEFWDAVDRETNAMLAAKDAGPRG